ncbi:beta propeller repeat protein [Halocatena pleomorpha]|uniref:Glycosyl hydrolase n=1 Tax=Halocatena pleomorpha TaxID=1785090 RepID=A0A3P3R9Q1_9EURY|nr:glycosyl hydrolase [Halocatena pleomorpha]RRJ29410.1 glycosyl hydrolase [Halocatena pleomorpha]
MASNKSLTRRRFVTLTATTSTSMALAGCGADQLPIEDEDKAKTDTETPPPTQREKTTTAEHEVDVEPGSHPRTDYQLAVQDKRWNTYPLWIDQNGRMYGRSGTDVTVSDDWYQTTEVLFSFEDIDDDHVQMVIVPESGNIITAVGGRGDTGGRIYRLRDDLSGAEKLYQFEYGRAMPGMGHAVYDDIIVLSCYALSDFEAEQYANEVILSTDGGQSFNRILKAPLKTTDAANLHIHDVEYDPYADRIWVVVGDNGNTQLYWSDDLGSSWETIAEQGEVTMLTQIAAFKDCVAFGTDGTPEGIIRWEREKPTDKPDGVDDLVRPYVKIETDPTDDTMEMYARGRWHIREDDGRELCLMAFGYSPMDTGTDSVVLASVNGAEWYELYRTETRKILLTNVFGPLSMDGPRHTVVSDSAQSEGYQINATVPKFWA